MHRTVLYATPTAGCGKRNLALEGSCEAPGPRGRSYSYCNCALARDVVKQSKGARPQLLARPRLQHGLCKRLRYGIHTGPNRLASWVRAPCGVMRRSCRHDASNRTKKATLYSGSGAWEGGDGMGEGMGCREAGGRRRPESRHVETNGSELG
jgi:hypothetical protein